MANIRAVNFSHWSGPDNPSGLAGINEFTAGIYYCNYYMISGFGTSAFNCTIPTGTGNFGTSYMTFGYSGFRQNAITLAFGKTLVKNFRAGIGINYLSIYQAEGYPKLNAFIPSLGFQLIIAKKFIAGVSVLNPARQSYNPGGYLEIPVMFTGGISYNFGDELIICFETEKITNMILKYTVGMEFKVNDFIFLRCGIIPHIVKEYTFGIGFNYKSLRLDISAIHHPVLGFSPSMGFIYIFKPAK